MMLDISRAVIVSAGLIGSSLLLIIVSLCVIWPRRQTGRSIDIEEAVRNAPYHLLNQADRREEAGK